MKIKKINEIFGEEETHWMFAYGSLSNTKLRHLLLDEEIGRAHV